MKKMICYIGMALLISGPCWSQMNENDTVITTIRAQKASLEMRADIYPDFVHLQWTKGPDDFTGNFELYRSADGVAYNIVRQFQPETFGNEADHHVYKDEDPLRGKNYYRLVAYDKFTQEKRTVELVAEYKNQPRKVQPTIVVKGQNLNIVNYDGEQLHLFVYTSGGTPLLQKVISSSVVNLSMDNLSSGIYIYQLMDRKKMVVSSGKFAMM